MPSKPSPKAASPAKKAPAAKAPVPKAAPVAAKEPAPKAESGAKPAAEKEKLVLGDSLCQIEILKDGHFFIARTLTEAGSKEYKNTVFEDMLTEMVISLQEQISD